MTDLEYQKQRFQEAYNDYRNRLEEFSCAENLALCVVSDLRDKKKAMMAEYEKLKQLDPNTPEL